MRYPHLRSDPDNPVDVESTDDGIRFVGAGGSSATISWDEVVGVWLQIQDPSNWPRPFSAILPNPNPLLSARAFTCELSFKSHRTLMIALRNQIEKRRWTQAEAAKRLSVSQPRISNLMRGKITLFSLGTLVSMASAAGLVIEVKVRKAA